MSIRGVHGAMTSEIQDGQKGAIMKMYVVITVRFSVFESSKTKRGTLGMRCIWTRNKNPREEIEPNNLSLVFFPMHVLNDNFDIIFEFKWKKVHYLYKDTITNNSQKLRNRSKV